MAELPAASAVVGDLNDEQLWTRRAITISWVSIAITILSGIIGITCAILYGSMAMLGYGLESFVDVFSSACVVWRFEKSFDTSIPAAMHDEIGHRLEKISGVGISFSFVAIALVVGIQAAVHLHNEHHPSASTLMQVMAFISVVAVAILGGFKWHISNKLESATLKKDAICSIAVGVISLAVGISTTIYSDSKSVWWFDAAVAVLVSVFLLIYGGRTIFCHGHQWWTCAFWNLDMDNFVTADDNVIQEASEMQEVQEDVADAVGVSVDVEGDAEAAE